MIEPTWHVGLDEQHSNGVHTAAAHEIVPDLGVEPVPVPQSLATHVGFGWEGKE
jgi:hypothetical protein